MFSFSGDIQDPPGQGPVQPALRDPASAGALDWVTHRGPFQPWPFCDSVVRCWGWTPAGRSSGGRGEGAGVWMWYRPAHLLCRLQPVPPACGCCPEPHAPSPASQRAPVAMWVLGGSPLPTAVRRGFYGMGHAALRLKGCSCLYLNCRWLMQQSWGRGTWNGTSELQDTESCRMVLVGRDLCGSSSPAPLNTGKGFTRTGGNSPGC